MACCFLLGCHRLCVSWYSFRAAKFEEGSDANARTPETEADNKNSPLEVLKIIPRIFREELLSERYICIDNTRKCESRSV